MLDYRRWAQSLPWPRRHGSATTVRPQALNWLLVAAAVALVPHSFQLPAWIVLLFAGAGVWRYTSDRYHWYRPGRTLRWALTLFVLTVIYRYYGTLLGRDPGVALLVALLGLKLLELKGQRDYVLTVFVLFLVILTGFFYAQSLWLSAYALAALMLCTATLLNLTQPSGLLPAQTLRLSASLVFQALPLMLVMYLLFPRIHGGLWALPSDAHGGVTGMSDVMRPGSIHQLSESFEPAFRATFTGPAPEARELYWRALVLWETDGRSWYPGQAARANESFTPQGQPYHYRIDLEPSNKPWLVALGLPRTVPAGAYVNPGYLLEWREPVLERLTYNLASDTHYRTGPISANERSRALRLPAGTSPMARALARRWHREHEGPAEIAQAALELFRRENFVYTLRPPLLGGNPVDEFLFEHRRGFCEHYAAAFVTLMRAAGIPSRVVIGYQGGDFNPAGDYYLVRQADAHAWAEIWLRDRGWVRMDPTAAIAPERVELGIDAVRRLAARGTALGNLSADAVRRALQLGWLERSWRWTRLTWDAVNQTWYRWVAGYSPERQRTLLSRLGLTKDSRGWWVMTLAGIAALLLGVLALSLFRPKREDPALALYRRFCRKLARAGLTRAPHEGALAFARRCAGRRPDLVGSIDPITQAYIRLRYAASPGLNDLRQLKQYVTAFRV